jgi:hypothetical protein
MVEIRLGGDGSWNATVPSKSRMFELFLEAFKRYEGEWSVKNDFLRIIQTRFGVVGIYGRLFRGASPWAAGKIREITDDKIVLVDGTTLVALVRENDRDRNDSQQ